MTQCLNCKQFNEDNAKFCINCGQKTSVGTLSFWSIISDFFSNLFDFETKIWRTCRDIWVPGRLTKAYMQGKRQSYYNPLRIFFVILFAFFTILLFQIKDSFQEVNNFAMDQEKKVWKENMISRFDSLASLSFTPIDSIDIFRDNLFKNEIKVPDSLVFQNLSEKSKKQLTDLTTKDSSTASIGFSEIVDTLIMQETITKIHENDLSDNINFNVDSVKIINEDTISNSIFKDFKMSDFYNLSNDALVDKYGKGNWFKGLVVTQIQKILKNLSSSIKFFIGNGTWAIFALIFLLAFFFKLLYIRHDILYVEHFIFHLYGHTRLLLLAIIGMLAFANSDYIWIFFWFMIGLIYLYIGMLLYYKQSIVKTFLKFVIVLFSYVFLLILCCLLILGISFMVL